MAPIKPLLYLLPCLACLACTALLAREYLRTRARLLLWSTLCFIGLSLNNVLLFLDLVVFPEFDLRLIRVLASLSGMLLLLYGFWELEP
jgi:hypothetical protein